MSTVQVSSEDVQAVAAIWDVMTPSVRGLRHLFPNVDCAISAMERMKAAAAGTPLPDLGLPPDPVSDSTTGAIAAHTMLEAWIAEGFDRPEAFAAVLTVLQANATAFALRGGMRG